MRLLRLPPAPRLDLASGINPFEWIVKQAHLHRAERQVALDMARHARGAELRILSRPVVPPK